MNALGVASALDLLRTTRATLLDDLLPALPQAQRYTGLMAVNALAVALRELEHGAHSAQAQHDLLLALLERHAEQRHVGDAPAAATTRAIRNGAFDHGSARDALQQALLRCTEVQLAIDNPKALHAAQHG